MPVSTWSQDGITKPLPAWGGAGTSPDVELLGGARDCREAMRVVELLSITGRAFEVDLEWAAGGSAMQRVSLTVPRETRVCVRADRLKVVARNLAPVENLVVVSIADGEIPTANYFEVRGTAAIGADDDIEIPRWAKSFLVETVGAANLAGLTLRVVDEQGTVRNELLGDAQPAGGQPVGAASVLTLHPTVNADYRVIFHLFL